MPEDDTRDGLRVGGWVPPISEDGPGACPSLRPPYRPALPRGVQRRALGSGHTESSTLRPRLVLAGAMILASAVTTAVAIALDDEPAPTPIAVQTQDFSRTTRPYNPAVPTGTISLLPPSSPSPTSAFWLPTSRAVATAKPSRSATPSRKPTPTPTTAKPTTPPPALTVGTTAGLESVDRPGARIRHRNFVAWLQPLFSDQDRPDTRFTVRTGRANANCFSLESANYPGFYLRHRNFEIRLDRSDRSDLFDQDATFCTVAIRQGTALALRSINYPAHYVVAEGDRLFLRESTAEQATAFLPRPPL